MKKKLLALSQVYRLLEPGPVVLLTSSHKKQTNVMTMSWHTMLEFEPPLIGCVISNRDFSFHMIKSTKECVINIPTDDLVQAVVGCGNTTGETVDKFEKFKLTPIPSSCVNPPMIQECYANLECIVVNTKLVNQYNFFVLEVIKAWIATSKKKPKTLHHQGKGIFSVDGKIIKTSSKMK